MSDINATKAAPACADGDLRDCLAWRLDEHLDSKLRPQSQARRNAEVRFAKIRRRPVEVVRLPRRLIGRRHQ